MSVNLLPLEPNVPVEGSTTNLIMVGQSGIGKTTLTKGLNKNGYKALVLDLQSGSKTIGGYTIDVPALARNYKTTPLQVLKGIIKQIREKNEEVKGFFYDFLVIDPLSDLKEVIIEQATNEFNSSVMGVSYNKNSAIDKFGKNYTAAQLKSVECDNVLNIGMNGWNFIYAAFDLINKDLKSLCPVTIYLAHTRYKTLKKDELSAEINLKEIDFWPTIVSKLVRDADDSGVLNREGDSLVIEFKIVEGQDCFKSRYFNNQKIVLSEINEDGSIDVYMERLFPYLLKEKN